jgi:hypothetical protein
MATSSVLLFIIVSHYLFYLVLPILIFNAFRVTWRNYLDIAMQHKASVNVSPCHRLEPRLSGKRGVTRDQQVASDTKKSKDPLANIVVTKPKNPSAEVSATRPKNPSPNLLPTEGYVLEIDGKYKTEYQTSEDALKAGLELKKKFPFIQVYVYDAKERTRTLVQLTEQLEKKTETAS